MRQKTFCQSPLQCVTFDPPPSDSGCWGRWGGEEWVPLGGAHPHPGGGGPGGVRGHAGQRQVARGTWLARAHWVALGTWSPRHTAWRIGTLAPLKLGWVSRNSLRYNYTTVDSTICSWQSVEESHTFWISLKYFLVVWHIIKHIKLFALNVLGT